MESRRVQGEMRRIGQNPGNSGEIQRPSGLPVRFRIDEVVPLLNSTYNRQPNMSSNRRGQHQYNGGHDVANKVPHQFDTGPPVNDNDSSQESNGQSQSGSIQSQDVGPSGYNNSLSHADVERFGYDSGQSQGSGLSGFESDLTQLSIDQSHHNQTQAHVDQSQYDISQSQDDIDQSQYDINQSQDGIDQSQDVDDENHSQNNNGQYRNNTDRYQNGSHHSPQIDLSSKYRNSKASVKNSPATGGNLSRVLEPDPCDYDPMSLDQMAVVPSTSLYTSHLADNLNPFNGNVQRSLQSLHLSLVAARMAKKEKWAQLKQEREEVDQLERKLQQLRVTYTNQSNVIKKQYDQKMALNSQFKASSHSLNKARSASHQCEVAVKYLTNKEKEVTEGLKMIQDGEDEANKLLENMQEWEEMVKRVAKVDLRDAERQAELLKIQTKEEKLKEVKAARDIRVKELDRLAEALKLELKKKDDAVEQVKVEIERYEAAASTRKSQLTKEKEELTANVTNIRMTLKQEKEKNAALEQKVDAFKATESEKQNFVVQAMKEIEAMREDFRVTREELLNANDAMRHNSMNLECLPNENSQLKDRVANMKEQKKELNDLQLSMQGIGEKNMSPLEKVAWIKDVYLEFEARRERIAILKEKVVKAKEELEVLKENRIKLDDMLIAADEERKNAERQGVVNAELENKLEELKVTLQEHEASVATKEKEIEAKEEINHKMETSVSNYKMELSQYKEFMNQIEQILKSKDVELAQVMKEIQEQTATQEEVRTKMTDLKLLLEKKEEDIAKERQLVSAMEEEITNMKRMLEGVKHNETAALALQEVRKKLQKKENNITALTAEYGQVKAEADTVGAELEGIQVQVDEIVSKIANQAQTCESDISDISKDVDDLCARMMEHENMIDILKETLVETKKDTHLHRSKIKGADASAKTLETKYAREKTVIEKKMSQTTGTLEEIKKVINELTQEVANLDKAMAEQGATGKVQMDALQVEAQENWKSIQEDYNKTHEHLKKELEAFKTQAEINSAEVESWKKATMEQEEKYRKKLNKCMEDSKSVEEGLIKAKREYDAMVEEEKRLREDVEKSKAACAEKENEKRAELEKKQKLIRELKEKLAEVDAKIEGLTNSMKQRVEASSFNSAAKMNSPMVRQPTAPMTGAPSHNMMRKGRITSEVPATNKSVPDVRGISPAVANSGKAAKVARTALRPIQPPVSLLSAERRPPLGSPSSQKKVAAKKRPLFTETSETMLLGDMDSFPPEETGASAKHDNSNKLAKGKEEGGSVSGTWNLSKKPEPRKERPSASKLFDDMVKNSPKQPARQNKKGTTGTRKPTPSLLNLWQ